MNTDIPFLTSLEASTTYSPRCPGFLLSCSEHFLCTAWGLGIPAPGGETGPNLVDALGAGRPLGRGKGSLQSGVFVGCLQLDILIPGLHFITGPAESRRSNTGLRTDGDNTGMLRPHGPLRKPPPLQRAGPGRKAEQGMGQRCPSSAYTWDTGLHLRRKDAWSRKARV